MNIVAFRPEHVRVLELQQAQRYFVGDISSEAYGRMLAQSPYSFSAVDGDRVIGCSGCVEIWDNRAMAWALISKDAGRHMVGVHKAVSGFLAGAKWRRIEASVDVGFAAGERWLKMLGFVCETPKPMRAYRPDGGDCYLYARTK
jgi:hypothetical protein